MQVLSEHYCKTHTVGSKQLLFDIIKTMPKGSIDCVCSFVSRDVSVCSKLMLNECRYMVIVHPLSRRLSSRRTLMVIMVIWVVSMIIVAPNLAYGNVFAWHFDDRWTICFIDSPNEQACVIGVFCIITSVCSQRDIKSRKI